MRTLFRVAADRSASARASSYAHASEAASLAERSRQLRTVGGVEGDSLHRLSMKAIASFGLAGLEPRVGHAGSPGHKTAPSEGAANLQVRTRRREELQLSVALSTVDHDLAVLIAGDASSIRDAPVGGSQRREAVDLGKLVTTMLSAVPAVLLRFRAAGLSSKIACVTTALYGFVQRHLGRILPRGSTARTARRTRGAAVGAPSRVAAAYPFTTNCSAACGT